MIRLLRVLTLLFVASLLGSCAEEPNACAWDKVELGMSPSQVRDLMGTPLSIQDVSTDDQVLQDLIDQLLGNQDSVQVPIQIVEWIYECETEYVYIQFSNNKVVQIDFELIDTENNLDDGSILDGGSLLDDPIL